MSICIGGGGISPSHCASKYWLVETAPKLRQRPLFRTSTHCGGHLNALYTRYDDHTHRSLRFFFLLLSLLRTAFTCSSVSFFDFFFFCLCRLTDARFHAGFWETVYDFTVVTRLLRNGRGAVRRSWRTARLDIYIILLLASEPRRCAPPPFLLRPNPLSPPTTSPPPTLSG